ncbi:hypothetical protein [Nocardiopsis dassonvillei]|uniref:hypothetical protein n=1 Tax=Nocardiopsis dassonvillei TaxID=2014 RepID=UPI003631EEBA
MSPREEAILQLIAAAEEVGLDAVVELPDDAPPTAVDLRVMRDGQVLAAIRARIEEGAWRHEFPARPWGRPLHSWQTRHLGTLHKVTEADLHHLDYWFGQLPTGRTPAPRPPRQIEDVPAWMRPRWADRARAAAPAGGVR